MNANEISVEPTGQVKPGFRRIKLYGSDRSGKIPEIWLFLLLLLLSGAACGPETQEERVSIHNGVRETLAALKNTFQDNPDSAIKQAEQALSALAAYPDPELEIRLNSYISKSLLYKKDFEKAEKKGLYALKLAEYHRMNIRLADIQINLGDIYWRWKKFDLGLSALFTARSVLKDYPGENELKGRLYNLVGLIYWELENLNDALEQFIRAEDYFRRDGYLRGLASTANNIGLIYDDSGNIDSALKCFLMAEDLYRRTGLRYGQITAALNIADQYNKTGDYEKSLAISDKARREAEQLNDISSLGHILNNMSYPYMNRKEFRQARQCLDQSLLYSKKINDKHGLIRVYDSFCEYFLRSGQYEAAEKTGREVLEMTSSAEMSRDKIHILPTLTRVFIVREKYREALQAYKEYLNLSDIQIIKSNLQKTKGRAIQYEAEKRNREILWLKQSHLARELELERITANRAVIITVTILALALTLLLFTLSSFKTRRQHELKGEIAAHKETQLRLRESEAMFRALAEQAPLGVFILQERLIRYANPHIAHISGFPQTYIYGCSPEFLICPEDWPAVRNYLEQAMENESPTFIRFRGRKENDEPLNLKMNAIPIQYSEKPALLGVIVDITHSLQLMEEVQKIREQESISRLAGGIAHDFNNLLAVIVGYLNLAHDNQAFLPPLAKEKIKTAEQMALRVAALICGVLQASSGHYPKEENADG